MKGRYKTLLLTYVWLGPLIVIIDQITKWAAYLNRVNVNIIPNFFDLQYTRNTGAAWSILEDYPWVLAII
ncbi:MAG: signal peptidase II, partial [Bacilli bacterium]